MTYFLFFIFIISLSNIIKILKLPHLQILPFIFVSLFIGFRYGIGIDYYNYEQMFESFNNTSYSINYEPLYYFLTRISPSYLWTNIFSAILILLPLYALCRKTKVNPTIFIAIFILSDMFFASFNIVRQMIALSWIMLGTWYLIENKFFYFLFFSIIAISFHYSSIFVILFILLAQKINFNLKIYFLLILLSFVMSKLNVFNNSILTLISQFSGYDHYLDNTTSYEGSGFKFIFYFLFYLVFPLLFLNKFAMSNNYNIICIKLISIGLCLSFLAITISILYRFSYSFLYFYVIFISSILTSIGFEILKKNKFLNLFILTSINYVFLLIVFYLSISNEVFGVKDYNWLLYEKIFTY